MQRRGVSLMEVMFSIGIIAVGLLGVIAVFPLALSDVGKGQVSERSARLGLAALDTFETHGMRRPDQWLVRQTNNVVAVDMEIDGTSGDQILEPSITPDITPDQLATAFCIDPRFVAGVAPLANANFDTRLFPHYPRGTNNNARMLRVTLRSRSDVDLNANQGPEDMGWAQADLICRSIDELTFDVPDEKLLPPVQQYGSAVTGAEIRRQDEGNFSWMATLAPNTATTGAEVESYTLSIVIFHGRDPGLLLYEDTNADGAFTVNTDIRANERIVSISDFYSLGFGGGDMELSGTHPEELDVKRGDWVMLMDTMVSGTPSASLFRWYRVVDTEEAPREVATNSYRRDVTLEGGDWPQTLAAPPNGNASNSTNSITKVVLVRGVVAVYERTVQLETTGLWGF